MIAIFSRETYCMQPVPGQGDMSSSLALLIEEGARLHRLGELTEAAERYRRALGIDPRNGDALYRLAQISCHQGAISEGLHYIERALAAGPRSGRAYLLQGMALAALGRAREALASFEAAIACDPTLAEAHGCRGDALSDLGRHGEAIESFDRALAFIPRSTTNWCNRGIALLALDRIDEALDSFDRATIIDPHFAQAHFNRGNTLIRLWRLEEAVGAFSQALAIELRYADALNNRAHAQRMLGRPRDALADIERALAIAPDHVDALVNHGALLFARAHLQEALASFERALALAPNHLMALMQSSDILSELGRLEDALKRIEAARAIAPHDADIGARADLVRDAMAQSPALFSPSTEWLMQRHVDLARRSDARADPPSAFVVGRHRVAYAASRGVTEIANAIVLAGEWQVLSDEQVLCDGVNQTPYPPLSAYHVAKVPPRTWVLAYPSARTLPVERAFLLGGCPNYGHWLFDYLPRIALWPGNVPLLVNDPLLPFQREALEHCGARADQLVPLAYPGAYRVQSLLYPSLQSLWCDPRLPFQPSIVDSLRERFAPLFSDRGPRRNIFITRRDATQPGGRRLINADETMAIAQQYEFEIVACETLSFAEQIALFSEARIIAGAHGAGLANMIFAPAGAHVIELIGPRYAHNPTGGPLSHLRLAAASQHAFTRIIGRSDPTAPLDHDRTANETFTIDASDFRKALDRSLKRGARA